MKTWVIKNFNKNDWEQYHWVVGATDKVYFVGKTTSSPKDLFGFLSPMPGEKIILPYARLNRSLLKMYSTVFDGVKNSEAVLRFKVKDSVGIPNHRTGETYPTKIGLSNSGRGDYTLFTLRVKDLPEHLLISSEQLVEFVKT